ncbi:alpha-S1-casein [Panthera leo]|uniref:alpha-S1-casein n=1 Tax=Panthera leo TaxID=9689 RepID=UPI001C6984E7|nr:alpha-S1-casein [Panthera leo]
MTTVLELDKMMKLQALTTMKLLILTCLVAIALARPNEPESREQRETSTSSSSEEVVPNNTQQKHVSKEDILSQRYLEQLHRLSKYNQLQLEALRDQQQLRRVTENNHIQLPFQQFYQLDAYPYAVWYYPPQVMQYIAYTPFYDVTKLTAPENTENVGVVPEW